jgi:tungstate transport system permease protein
VALGLPLGAALALLRFPGRRFAAVLFDALMGLPPVVVGLVVYLFLSRSGPLGFLEWLFTPKAMVLAQWILITPIVTALSRQVVEDMWDVLAGFGRAIAEVGAVIIVGGNIAHLTRVMTTAIALETSKGELALALALGIVLLMLSLVVNTAATLARDAVRGSQG